MHAMAGGAQAGRERAHGREDRQDLLRMVQHVVGFLPDLHQYVDHAGIDPREPGMLRVQLIAQHQAQRVGRSRRPRGRRHWRALRCRLQRSEQ